MDSLIWRGETFNKFAIFSINGKAGDNELFYWSIVAAVGFNQIFHSFVGADETKK